MELGVYTAAMAGKSPLFLFVRLTTSLLALETLDFFGLRKPPYLLEAVYSQCSSAAVRNVR